MSAYKKQKLESRIVTRFTGFIFSKVYEILEEKYNLTDIFPVS